MSERLRFNPLSGNFDMVEVVPELTADPASPAPESAWVLKTVGMSGGGEIKAFLGLGFPVTSVGVGGPDTYELRYRTTEGTTIGVALT